MDKPNLDDLKSAFERTPFLRQLSRALVGSGVYDADDLMQDAWVIALERPPGHSTSLGAWFARVLRSRAYDSGTKSRRRSDRERVAARSEAQVGSPSLDELELQGRILGHVLALDERYREVVQLRFYDGLGPTAIARRLELPVKTVKTRLTRALEELRERLDRDAGGDREVWLAALFPLVDMGPSPASMLPGLGKVISMKKALASLIVVALIGMGLVVWLGPLGPAKVGAEELRAVALPDLEPERPDGADELARSEQGMRSQREIVESAPAAALVLGSLLVSFEDESGQPLAEMGVALRARRVGIDRDQLLLARTDALGEVRFEGLVPGSVYVLNDFGTASGFVEIEAGEESVLRLVGVAGMVLDVRVVDEDGVPVAGAELWGEPNRLPWPTYRLLGSTDALGHVVLDGLGQWARIGARAAGYTASPVVEVWKIEQRTLEACNVELVMGAPGGSLFGRVVDLDGQPVPGAAVLAGWRGGWVRPLPSGVQVLDPPPIRSLTDADGRFEVIGDLPEDRVPVWVDAPGWAAWYGSAQIELGRRTELLVELGPGATVVGRVLDSEGEAVVGGRVVVGEEQDGGWYYPMVGMPSGQTDEQGHFRIEGVGVGRLQLNASAGSSRQPRGKAQTEILAEAGQTIEVELVLSQGLVISGRVVDRAGQPVPGWRVDSQVQRPAGQWYARAAVTDDDGAFMLVNLGTGLYTLSLQPAGLFEEPWAEVRDVETGTKELEIIVDVDGPDAFVKGVINFGGRALPSNAVLSLWPELGGMSFGIDLDLTTGRFNHGPIAAGSYVLHLSVGPTQLLEERAFEVEAGGILDLGVLSTLGVGSVEVVFVGEDPDDELQLSVWLTPEGGGLGSRWLDPDHPMVNELAEGRWLLRRRTGPYFVAPQWIDVRAGETTRVECAPVLAPERLLSCQFASKDTVWKRLTVEIRDTSGGLVFLQPEIMRGATRDRNIPLQILRLPDGRYLAMAKTDSGLRGELELVFGKHAGVELSHTIELR